MRAQLVLGVVLALLGGPAAALAQADTTTSNNWSGYAVHRSGVEFHRVSGQWRQPTGTCIPGHSSYSAFWVGIGGFSLNSGALEQIGSEFDCTAAGRPRLSVWYELVPAPSRSIQMTVRPGDQISAWVKVARGKVALSLSDLSRHETFTKTLADRNVDTGSAEWIAEAPSNCYSATACQILRLADFGSVGFSKASAETTRYEWGSISSSLWNTTRIVLGSRGTGYVSGGGPLTEAMPSSLRRSGHAFSVSYTGLLGGGSGGGSGATVAGVRSLTRLAGTS